MTYEPTVKDQNGNPVMGLLVSVNDEITGETFSRTTDGSGYANVALLGHTLATDRVTVSIFDPQMRFMGYVAGDAKTASEINGKFTITIIPFV